MQHLALEQRRDPDIQRRLSQPRKQGRPLTIFPLWSEMILPLPLSNRDLFINTKLQPHLFNAPRAKKNRVDRLGYSTDYFFHPLLIVLGPQGRRKLHLRYRFSDVEEETVFILYKQFDNKLGVYLRKKRAEANKGVTLAPLDDDDDDDGNDSDDSSRHRAKRRRKPSATAGAADQATVGDENVFWSIVASDETQAFVHN